MSSPATKATWKGRTCGLYKSVNRTYIVKEKYIPHWDHWLASFKGDTGQVFEDWLDKQPPLVGLLNDLDGLIRSAKTGKVVGLWCDLETLT